MSKLRYMSFAIAAFAGICASIANAQSGLPSIYLREVNLMDTRSLVQVRENCALDHMPGILAKVQQDNPGEALPRADAYCLRALAVSADRNFLADLYADLALQEQGYSEFAFAEDAQFLKHDEAGRTTGAILRAANSGAANYAGITGKTRDLPCPLALDAGFTWAYRNPDKPQPVVLTVAQAAATARACYQPAAKVIAVGKEVLPASKAGLYAGAWLGRQQRQQTHTAGN